MKKMTSRERLLAAAKREPVDMLPLSPRVGYAAHYHCGSETPQNMLRLKKIYDYNPFITISGQDLPLFGPYEAFSFTPGVDVDIQVKDNGPKRTVDRTIHTPDGDLHEVILVANPGHTEYGSAPDPVRTEYTVKSPDDLPKIKYLLPPVNTSLADEYHGWENIAGDEAVIRACIYGPLPFPCRNSFMN